MARGRFISKSVSVDYDLAKLSDEELLAFFHAIPHLDRDGLIDGRPLVISGVTMPTRPYFRELMPGIIDAWVSAGIVQRYYVADDPGQPVLWFPGFRKNQDGLRYSREAPSIFPPPPGTTRDSAGLVACNGNAPDPSQDQAEEPDEQAEELDDEDLTVLIVGDVDLIADWRNAFGAEIGPKERKALASCARRYGPINVSEAIARCIGRTPKTPIAYINTTAANIAEESKKAKEATDEDEDRSGYVPR